MNGKAFWNLKPTLFPEDDLFFHPFVPIRTLPWMDNSGEGAVTSHIPQAGPQNGIPPGSHSLFGCFVFLVL